MVQRKHGKARICRPKDREQGPSAFVLAFLPPSDSPAEYDHHELVDPYYSCFNARVCGCPLATSSSRWKVECTLPGGAFDGRVRGLPPSSPNRQGDDQYVWERNLVRPLSLAQPMSAYAVITPDGLWHECVEPEPQDLVVGKSEVPSIPFPSTDLTALQKAWRLQIAEFLMRYQHCWLLGLEALLSSEATRTCSMEIWASGTGPADVDWHA
jgi:hypothetical protein